MILMMVDLPEPFSPARQWIWPRRTASETWSSARTPAKRFSMSRSSIRMSDMGSGRPAVPFCSWLTGDGSEIILGHVLLGHADPALAVEQAGLGRVGPRQAGIARQRPTEP